MARTVNEQEHDAKRNAILDAAEHLLLTRGYEQTAIQDVLDALEMSKGAFYHYFESKSELVLAVVQRRTAAVEDRLRAIVADRGLSGRDKLLRHFRAVDDWKLSDGRVVSDLARAWYADDNAIVRDRLYRTGVQRFAPLLTRIIEQGVDEGAFTTRYPEQAARMILCLRHELGRAITEALVAKRPSGELARMAGATADAVERLLGAQPGSFVSPERDALVRWQARPTTKKTRVRR